MRMTTRTNLVCFPKIGHVVLVICFHKNPALTHCTWLLLFSPGQKKATRKPLPSDVKEGRTVFIRFAIFVYYFKCFVGLYCCEQMLALCTFTRLTVYG